MSGSLPPEPVPHHMPSYVAFLRAINVGGHTVRMDRLRALFEETGLENVRTFIASGNVIFDTPDGDTTALEERIERHLRGALGYEVGTFLRSTAEVAAVAAHQPFGPADPVAAGHTLMIVFLKTPPGEELRRRLAELRSESDDFHVHGREVYWLTRGRMSDSPAAVPLGKALGTSGTMRNATTVRKLAAKYAAPG